VTTAEPIDAVMTVPPSLSDAARAVIDTPALVVDLDRTDAAIERMQRSMTERGWRSPGERHATASRRAIAT